MDAAAQSAMMQQGSLPSAEQAAQQQKQQEAAEEQRAVMLTAILTKEAHDRLQRVQLVKPDKAREVEEHLLKKARMGQLGGKVSEEAVIAMLQAGSGAGAKGSSSVIFRRRDLDNDDEW